MIRNDNEKDLVCHYLYGIVILSSSKERGGGCIVSFE